MRPLSLLLLVACAPGASSVDEADPIAATAADLDLSPTTLDLGEVAVGDEVSDLISVRNTGEGPGAVSLAVEGTLAQAYTLDPYVDTIAPATHENFTLTLAPTGWGDHDVEVVVSTTAGEEVGRVIVQARVIVN